jgi:hypothetical protein
MSWNGATAKPASRGPLRLPVPERTGHHQFPAEVQQFLHASQLRNIRDEA